MSTEIRGTLNHRGSRASLGGDPNILDDITNLSTLNPQMVEFEHYRRKIMSLRHTQESSNGQSKLWEGGKQLSYQIDPTTDG